MRKSRLILFLLTLCFNAIAVTQFEIVFGGKGYDYGNCIIQTPDKGYVILGSTSGFGSANTDIYLAKIDSAGVGKWQQLFGTTGVEKGSTVFQTADKGFVVGGYTNGMGYGGYDFFLMKADSNGNWLWSKAYGGTDWDFGFCANPTSDGGIIMAGGTYSYGSGNEDGYVVRTDADGNFLWSKTYGGAQDDELKSVKQTDDGGYILSGITKSYGEINGDLWLLKIDSAGTEVWSKRIGKNAEDVGNDVIELSAGGFLVVGQTFSFAHGGDAYLIKTSTTGDTIWTRLDGGDAEDLAYSVVELPNGKFAFAGLFGTANGTGGGGQDFRYAIYDLNGWYVNGRTRGGLQDELCKSIIHTTDGGLAMVGETRSYGNGLTDIYVIKTDSMGFSTNTPVVLNYMSVEKNENISSHINVFPNPVANLLHINSSESININSICVENLLGQTVFNNNGYTAIIDAKQWLPGVYIVKVYTHSGFIYTQKIVKE